ncbi:oxidoreductase [Pseudomonas sp. KCA11]|uniref:acrylyl-CoA reductase (NADPH) n=1 Tax=unclassified Pseudomonas TaxID=196821 RepID=UPI001F3B83E6|nr:MULTISPECIES: MDR family oxidoreductase [unclassified Pseudomonas]MCE5992988.1 oxidoreductase [Pseudomonas sp. KCA11]UMY63786.1 oxidoreductase [Pseudomonas sp. LS.1a]
MFKAILIEKLEDKYSSRVTELQDDQLPTGNVTVKVAYSTLNYKDALAITGKGPVVRQFPMVPGIDLAGTVEASDDPRYQPGDRVLLNGWGVGESHWGGLAQKARLNGDWLIPHPERLDERQTMAIGTAGYTAMLCLMALERHGLKPSDGPVLVTGATGGVGSFAISLLAGAGYTVTAATGKTSEAAYLKSLGATTIIDRAELSAPGRPLAKEKWAAVIDSVGSHTLANACASTMSEGLVAACGLAQGMDFPATVAPFILRGVSLLGINSVTQPFERRVEAWERLSDQLNLDALSLMSKEIRLESAIAAASELMDGKIRGRLIVDVNGQAADR